MIRRDTDYAFRMLARMSQQGRDVATARQLCDGLGVPCVFAQKILRRLVGGGLLQARPGRNGGYWLARSAKEITMMDVLAAVQGPLALNACLDNPSKCSRQSRCNIRRNLARFQDRLEALFCGVTLADLASTAPQRPAAGELPGRRGPGGHTVHVRDGLAGV